MSAARSNVSALNPEFWSAVMQVPLRKSLVAGAVANTQFEPVLVQGDTIHFPYWQELGTDDYVPGTDITGIQDVTGTDETLVVDKKKVVRFYVNVCVLALQNALNNLAVCWELPRAETCKG